MADLTRADAASQVMEHFIWHDAHGYSQIHRDGDGTTETIRLSDGETVSFAGGDRDCSRLVQTCWVVVGVLPRGLHMWTGNEIAILRQYGFKQVDLGAVRRGDVLWRSGHTGMFLGEGWQGEAVRSELHSIDGATGDQDGQEIARNPYNRWEWESAWRYVEPEPAPKPAKLVVDGMIGANTVRAWQRAEGVTETGVINNQIKAWKAAHFPALASVSWGTSGASIIRKIQKRFKLDVDGLIGPNTAMAIQKRLKSLGYDPGPIDGMIGAGTAKALQRALNDGRWP